MAGVRRSFRPGLLGREARPAVQGASLEVHPGEVVGLIGESGSGKTTLVRIAMGLEARDAGEVRVDGRPVPARPPRDRRPWRRVQMLFQNPDAHLNPWLTVEAVLRESARLHRPGEDARRVSALALEAVGLEHRAGARPRELSGGERRRVGIARVLLARPALVLADEPTAGLDAALKHAVVALLLQGEPPPAVLLVSHDLPLVASVCDRVVVMQAGRTVEGCPAGRLGRGPHHPHTFRLLAAAGLLASEPAREPLEGGT